MCPKNQECPEQASCRQHQCLLRSSRPTPEGPADGTSEGEKGLETTQPTKIPMHQRCEPWGLPRGCHVEPAGSPRALPSPEWRAPSVQCTGLQRHLVRVGCTNASRERSWSGEHPRCSAISPSGRPQALGNPPSLKFSHAKCFKEAREGGVETQRR